ncbi:MAG: hypothetical protein HYZ49_04675 [Chloroflexi bacterium]|nr:hypothetical protein [Chloroflexota bacterium]
MSEPTNKRPWSQILLWVIAVTSLLLNLIVINTLLSVRRQAGQAFAEAAGMVDDLKSSRFDYAVNIDEDLPIAANVPIDFTVQVPISETIPISTTVSVPIQFPLIGRRTIEVPISTRIPISLTVEVPIKQTIPIAANVPVQFDVPISIELTDTPLAQSLDEVELILLGLADGLGATDP